MIFLDPRSDIVFKKLFGDIAHKRILINFLNSVLAEPGRKEIVDVALNDPHNIPESVQFKASIVNVRCTDTDGNQYIIEMQVVMQKDYVTRAQYYNALGLCRQLGSGQHYHKLMPVIFVGVLNFSVFDNPDYISHHSTLDKKTFKNELRHQEYHFIELDKFTKDIDELDGILDQWTYFLKHAVTLNEVPQELKTPVLEEAFDILVKSNWSAPELEAYDHYLDALRCSQSQLETALETGLAKGEAMGLAKGLQQGLQEGIQQGLAQGLQQGIQQGHTKGILEGKLVAACALLDILDPETIAQKIGLSVAQVEELKKNKQ